MNSATTPTPAGGVEFGSQEAANRILGTLYREFQAAAESAAQHDGLVRQRSEEIARRQETINQFRQEVERLEAANSTADFERAEAVKALTTQRSIAQAAADTMALLGSPLPPEQTGTPERAAQGDLAASGERA